MAGVAVVQQLPALPPPSWGLPWAAALFALAALCRRCPAKHRWARRGAALWLGIGLGLGWAVWQGQARLDTGLGLQHDNTVSRLIVRVADLPQGDGSQWRFTGELDADRPPGIPERIAVSWRAANDARFKPPVPGQVWRMALILRRPHGARNPHGPDVEGRWFAAGIRATASVRGIPRLLRDQPWASTGIAIERMRHHVREGMRSAIGERRYAPVLIALAMGDQAAVPREDWQVFNRTGITHLVSISGMHVTLIAGLGGALVAAVWRRARWRHWGLPEWLPAQTVAAAAALLVAWLYCLLAGWGVPARRTFFMLAVVAISAMLRLPLTASRVLALAAAAVVVIDPWAVLAPGFWLSYGAVAILLRAAQSTGSPTRAQRDTWAFRLRRLLREFTRVQMAITLGLVPLLANLMHQVSLASPLANAFAIPVVSFLVTPLALLCAAFCVVPGLQAVAQICGIVGHEIFEFMMVPVTWIEAAPWAVFDVAAAPWPWAVLAITGVAWALQAPGWPMRGMGWMLMVPMLCWRPERPQQGYWTLTALDVGQGSAVVVETATQVWLFDTGPRQGNAADAGARAIVPFLRARGHGRLDGMVVSHGDVDHAGGLASVLATVPVRQAWASFDLPELLSRQPAFAADPNSVRLPGRVHSCVAGQSWQSDGVTFRILHPPENSLLQGNQRSCVVRLEGRTHAALLPGDIGASQERGLTARLPPTDVVLAPHHGSASSSSAALVQAARARHVIAQVGHLNHFRHPAPSVQARWQGAGAQFWRTDRHGSVTVASTAYGLVARAQAMEARRYWHAAPQ